MSGETKTVPHFSDAMVNHHLEAVLRASGSSLRYYSMEKTLEEMRGAMRKAMVAAAEATCSAEGLV